MSGSRAQPARVRVRYRPAADVLQGDIDLGVLSAGDPAIESPDADTHLRWLPVLGGPEVLVGFHVVHAAARLRAGPLTALPTPLARLVPHLVDRGRAALPSCADALERTELVVQVDTQLPAHHLGRPAMPGHPPAEWTVEPADVARTAAGLHRLASAVRATAALASPDIASLASAIDELGSVISHADGRVAPGAAAAAGAQLAAVTPLDTHVRAELRALLDAVDHTEQWPAVWALTDDLCASVAQSRVV